MKDLSLVESLERARVAELKAYGILDTPNEPVFDELVRSAAKVFGARMAVISFIDEDRQWHKARHNVDARETPRAISFCTHAIQGSDVMVVDDAREDERFAQNPYVIGEPNIRFYAGTPLKTPTGKRIGTLCVFDNRTRPGGLSDEGRRTLEEMGCEVMKAVEARRQKGASAAGWRERRF